ncbi:MAG: DsbA family protein [Myxococcota bacterium]
MSRGSDLDAARLTVVLDIRDPRAFLALAPAIAFGRELGVAINWLPLAAEPLRPPSAPGPDDDRGARHRRHRADMIAREIAVYAQAQGLTLEEPYRNAPADAAHQAWLWMRGQAPERLEAFLLELFRRYWVLELDASDPHAVAKVISACGEDGDGFLSWAESEGSAALARVAADLAEAGVFAVPAYRVCDQVFLGRQHLPMIRWLLEGEQGPMPI